MAISFIIPLFGPRRWGTIKYMGAPTFDHVVASGIRHYISPSSQGNSSQYCIELIELDER